MNTRWEFFAPNYSSSRFNDCIHDVHVDVQYLLIESIASFALTDR